MPTILKIKRTRLVFKHALNSLTNNSWLTLQSFLYIFPYVALINLPKYFSSHSRYSCITSSLSTLLWPNKQSTVSIYPFSRTPVFYHWVIFQFQPPRSSTNQFVKHSSFSLPPRTFLKSPWKFPPGLLATFHPPPLSCLHHPLSLWFLHSHIVLE